MPFLHQVSVNNTAAGLHNVMFVFGKLFELIGWYRCVRVQLEGKKPLVNAFISIVLVELRMALI